MAEAIISRRGYTAEGKPTLITQTFTSNIDFVVPNTRGGTISVLLFGAGGAGNWSAGGGGGWMNNKDVDGLQTGETIHVTIGQPTLQTGGTTSFGTYLSANGGGAGGSSGGGNGGSGGGSGGWFMAQNRGGPMIGGIGYQFGGGGPGGNGGPWGGGGGGIQCYFESNGATRYHSNNYVRWTNNAKYGQITPGTGGQYGGSGITAGSFGYNGTNTVGIEEISGDAIGGKCSPVSTYNGHSITSGGGGGGYGGRGGHAASSCRYTYCWSQSFNTSNYFSNESVHMNGYGAGGGEDLLEMEGNGFYLASGGGGGYGYTGAGGNGSANNSQASSGTEFFGGGGGGYGKGGEYKTNPGFGGGGAGARWLETNSPGGQGICIIQYYV